MQKTFPILTVTMTEFYKAMKAQIGSSLDKKNRLFESRIGLVSKLFFKSCFL